MDEKDHANSSFTPLGITDWRNRHKVFGIKDQDRFGHIYVIGKTGTGKSTLLTNMAISDIERGNGFAFIDPHGDVAETLLNYIPKNRIQDVIYFNPADSEFPVGLNPLSEVDSKYHHLIASGLISTLKKIWADSWGPRLEYILRLSLLTLLSFPGATLLDIQPLLTDFAFRQIVLQHVTSPHIIAFWKNEFEKYSPTLRAETISPILNKTGLFVISQPLRNIVGQKTSSFQMQEVMDEKKILIANLSKGEIGEDASTILGSMLVTTIQLAALGRSKLSESQRIPFYLFVDEMHSFVSLSFADVLAEARKYKVGVVLSHQYIDQLHEKIRAAIFGNAGTIISFRVGAADAEHLAKEFYPVFAEPDLVNLPSYSMYLKLMIDGATSKPFSALTIQTNQKLISNRKDVMENSKQSYSKNQKEVERKNIGFQSNLKSAMQEKLF